MVKKIRLASKSPRRRELIKYLDIPYTILAVDTEENAKSADPEEAACEISLEKARASFETKPLEDGEVVIGADTTVCTSDKILGKPGNRDDAFKMLRLISGKTHTVVTGITLIYIENGETVTKSFAETTKVIVEDLSDGQINAYLDLDEYSDKAGSYAIQGPFSRHIKGIEGDYNNVVGFPVARVYKELQSIGK